MVQQQDPSASAACRHTAIAECIADSMAAKGWACEFCSGKATNFNKTIYDYIWIVLGIFPSWRDLESLLLVLLHQRIPRASLLANKYGKAPVMKHLHAPHDKTVVGTLANHINMLLCSPEVEATFKKALKNHC